jgi:hypothetical protein
MLPESLSAGTSPEAEAPLVLASLFPMGLPNVNSAPRPSEPRNARRSQAVSVIGTSFSFFAMLHISLAIRDNPHPEYPDLAFRPA